MKRIIVSAAIILNEQHELLVVRKQGTHVFMQVGGKLEPNETPEQTIRREIKEEISCDIDMVQYIGCFETKTANEPDYQLTSYLFFVKLLNEPKISAEIAQMKWVTIDNSLESLAPLTREIVIPWCQANIVK